MVGDAGFPFQRAGHGATLIAPIEETRMTRLLLCLALPAALIAQAPEK